eukprot:158581-Pelagomonas_calceolata.AAC.5
MPSGACAIFEIKPANTGKNATYMHMSLLPYKKIFCCAVSTQLLPQSVSMHISDHSNAHQKRH